MLLGAWLAWARIDVAACWRTLACVKFIIPLAISVSSIRDLAALKFSLDKSKFLIVYSSLFWLAPSLALCSVICFKDESIFSNKLEYSLPLSDTCFWFTEYVPASLLLFPSTKSSWSLVPPTFCVETPSSFNKFCNPSISLKPP